MRKKFSVAALVLAAALLALALALPAAVGLALTALVITTLLGAALYVALSAPPDLAPGVSALGDAAAASAAPVSPASPYLSVQDVSPLDPGLVLAAMEQSPESMAVVDQNGALLYANRTFLQRSGYALQEVIGRLAREVSANGMSDVARTQMRAVVERGDVWRGVLNNRRKDGTEIQEGVSISPLLGAQGQIIGFVELKQDITELMQAREQLAQLLSFDTVTLLPNRWALSQRLDEMVGKAESFPLVPAYWHALLLMDLDGWSKLHAAHGAQWSDALLRAIAQNLQSLLPPTAWVARTAGNEFAVILCDAARSRHDARMMAYTLATQLQRGLATSSLYRLGDGSPAQLSFCVGITVFPFTEPARKRDSQDHIYRRATLALYQAKAQGAGSVHAFSEALEHSTQRKLTIEHGLYEALAHDHLHMYVQKQVDIEGQVRGVEALLRWQPPGESLVSPGVFIPIAEESELIVQLGDWMLHQATHLLGHPLLRDTAMWVAVNISAKQFLQADFVDKIAALLSEKQIGPGRLRLEVTESMVLTNVEEAIQIMTRLNALGVHCALDDFGTGYSSLSYLHRLPIQEIKIDQSFIHHLEPDGKSGALVQALLMVAKSLQLRVVAEGVEQEDQAALLRAWYPAILCQGYLYSRPMPVSQWLQELAQGTGTLPTEP
ncbi:MAG: EAL domain-containing protein [Comamonas sp.]|nr:EAL domain-containing protein [Candidatus Comamonas equi]